MVWSGKGGIYLSRQAIKQVSVDYKKNGRVQFRRKSEGQKEGIRYLWQKLKGKLKRFYKYIKNIGIARGE